jgi:uncharacterized membrane protein YeiB
MTLAEPVAEKRKTSVARLAGVDLARGLAVFGMFASHVGPAPSVGGVTGVLMDFASGRSSALFATLAGLSLAIISGRQEPATGLAGRRAAARIAIRAVVLLLFGTALTMAGTGVVVILAYYGVFFLLALPFARMRPVALAISAAVWAVAGPVLSFVVRSALAGSGWDKVIDANDPIRMIGGDGVLQLFLNGGYPTLTWMPFVLAGMALGRLDLAAAATRIRLAVIGPALALAGYGGSWLALQIFGTPPGLAEGAGGMKPSMPESMDKAGNMGEMAKGAVSTGSPKWLLTASPHSGTTFEIVGNVGVAVMVLVVALVVAERLPKLWRPITAVGTMSLTVYVLHAVAIGVLGLSAGPGEPGYVLLGFIAGAIVFALVWSRFFQRGPLEFLLHRSTLPAQRIR